MGCSSSGHYMTWAGNIITQHLKGMLAQEQPACVMDKASYILWISNRQARVFCCIIAGQ